MTSLFRTFVLTVLGLAFAVFGIVHATRSYPDPKDFAAVIAVGSFGFGVAAAVLGLALLVPVALRLRRRLHAQQVPASPGLFTPRMLNDRRDEDFDFDPDADPFGYDPEEDNFASVRPRGGGYDGHPGAASAYAPVPGRNGHADHRSLVAGRR